MVHTCDYILMKRVEKSGDAMGAWSIWGVTGWAPNITHISCKCHGFSSDIGIWEGLLLYHNCNISISCVSLDTLEYWARKRQKQASWREKQKKSERGKLVTFWIQLDSTCDVIQNKWYIKWNSLQRVEHSRTESPIVVEKTRSVEKSWSRIWHAMLISSESANDFHLKLSLEISEWI